MRKDFNKKQNNKRRTPIQVKGKEGSFPNVVITTDKTYMIAKILGMESVLAHRLKEQRNESQTYSKKKKTLIVDKFKIDGKLTLFELFPKSKLNMMLML